MIHIAEMTTSVVTNRDKGVESCKAERTRRHGHKRANGTDTIYRLFHQGISASCTKKAEERID